MFLFIYFHIYICIYVIYIYIYTIRKNDVWQAGYEALLAGFLPRLDVINRVRPAPPTLHPKP